MAGSDNVHDINSGLPRRTRNSSGGAGASGGGSDLEARVAKLESHVEYMRRDISDIRADMKAMAADVVAMKLASAGAATKLSHIDDHMVTKGQLSLYALLTILPIVGGGWWVIQQYLAPLLKALSH